MRLRLKPNSCADSIYSIADGHPSTMAALQNLVPAPDTQHQWLPKPGAKLLATPSSYPTKIVILTSGTSWTVPPDCSLITYIYAIGAGGYGSATGVIGGGGGGGAFSLSAQLAVTPNNSIPYQIGVGGGSTGAGTAPTANTWFKDVSTCVAAGGASASGTGGAAGGTAGNSVTSGAGGVKYAGGAGGTCGGGADGGGGGGGAAGVYGAGAAGATTATAAGGVGGQGDNGTGGAGGAAGLPGASGSEFGLGLGAGGGGGGFQTGLNWGQAGGNFGGGGGGSYTGGPSPGANGFILILYNSTVLSPSPCITCYTVVGNLVVGMMNDPGGSGTDIPFVYNLQSNALETVTGFTVGLNTPTSPPGAGTWQPPHIEPVGHYCLISHPGYTQQTASMFFGAIDLSPLVLPQKTIILTAGSSWIVPADWNNAVNQIQCIGAGANGGDGGNGLTGSHGGAGGNGGAYSSVSNQTLSGTYAIGVGTAGGPTYITGVVEAAGGSSGSNLGTIVYAGGTGAPAGAFGDAGGGGGGAGGPYGAGIAYGTGGAAGYGGAGDVYVGGAGGAYTGGVGGPGGAGTEIGSTSLGSGGGGGGGVGGHGAGSNGSNGGAGGAYGAGGGGGGNGYSSRGAGGLGSQGIIIITYTPVQVALTYTVQNTTTNALISPPVWITQFNSRAYFFCNPGGTNAPAVYCSDNFAAGGPLSRGAAVAGVILTFGDTVPLIGGGVLSLTNISTGGVTQALFVFKQAGGGATNMFQITGDVSTTNLTIQAMNTSVSTNAPNTIVSTPQGLFFVSLDGLRFVDTSGNVQPPVGFGGSGVTLPFLYSSIPSRMCAACNSNTIRIATTNGANGLIEDWCYDLVRQAWYGPHTFPIGLIASYGNTFILTPTTGSGSIGLYQSDLTPSSTSVYTELSSNMTCIYQSGYFPDREDLYQLSCVDSVVYQGHGAGTSAFTVNLVDETGALLPGSGVTLGFSGQAAIAAIQVPWTQPIIFDRMQVQIVATATAGLRFGDFLLDYEVEEYLVTST